jgi:hypothetical protein
LGLAGREFDGFGAAAPNNGKFSLLFIP